MLRRASSRAVYPRQISRPFCVLWKCSNFKTFASVSILNNKQPTPKAGVFEKVLPFYPLLGDISWINWMMQVFSVADVVGLGLSFFHGGFHLGNQFVLASCSKEVKISHKLSVLLYFSILGERPLNIGAIQESCTCESQKSVIRRKVTPNLHTCAAEAQKEREPVSRFPLKKCLSTGRLSGID